MARNNKSVSAAIETAKELFAPTPTAELSIDTVLSCLPVAEQRKAPIRAAAERFCFAVELAQAAEAQLAADGLFIYTPEGRMVEHPAVATLAKANASISSLLVKLSLKPGGDQPGRMRAQAAFEQSLMPQSGAQVIDAPAYTPEDFAKWQ